MSKAVRWRVPFASINGTQYRLDIYDEGYSGDPIILTAGTTPFVTKESDSDDIFSPVRSQTGSLQIVTKIEPQTAVPGGGMLKLNDILPAENIDRPVKLWKLLGGGAAGLLEWQGFLSCEAYNQDYVGIPQTLTLSVISVLEAMDSVQIDPDIITGMKKVATHIYNTIAEIDTEVGLTSPLISAIYISYEAWNIFRKHLDATALYEMKEYSNESSKTYVVSGLSCKKVLSNLCTLMGFTCREQGSSLYFQRLGEACDMLQYSPANKLKDSTNTLTHVNLSSANIADLVWKGKKHQRSVIQGAKSVEVIANLAQYEMELALPEFPTEDMLHGNSNLIESYAQMNVDFNNTLTFYYYYVQTDGDAHFNCYSGTDTFDAYEDCALDPNCDTASLYPRYEYDGRYYLRKNLGAFFAKLNFSTQEEINWWDGLFISAANELNVTTSKAPTVFKMDSLIGYRFTDGKLVFKVSALTVVSDGTSLSQFMGVVQMKLQFGTRYWNGSAWQNTATYFDVDFANSPIVDENSGYVLEIPITSSTPLSGNVVIEIRGSIKGGTEIHNTHQHYYQPFYDLFIYELGLTYEPPEYITESDREANHYYRLLGTHFRDEISIDADLASSLNNRPSPSLIMESDDITPVTLLPYVLPGGGTENRRPEIDLLNRMAHYYQAARQTLKLICAHPTTAALPLLKLRGINDNRIYLPMAERRDWRNESSQLTCMEWDVQPDESSSS